MTPKEGQKRAEKAFVASREKDTQKKGNAQAKSHGTKRTIASFGWATTAGLSKPSSFSQPAAVAITSDLVHEFIYIADTGNNRILKVEVPKGTPEGVWADFRQKVMNTWDQNCTMPAISNRPFELLDAPRPSADRSPCLPQGGRVGRVFGTAPRHEACMSVFTEPTPESYRPASDTIRQQNVFCSALPLEHISLSLALPPNSLDLCKYL